MPEVRSFGLSIRVTETLVVCCNPTSSVEIRVRRLILCALLVLWSLPADADPLGIQILSSTYDTILHIYVGASQQTAAVVLTSDLPATDTPISDQLFWHERTF